jgi:hypothetical protein
MCGCGWLSWSWSCVGIGVARGCVGGITGDINTSDGHGSGCVGTVLVVSDPVQA